MYQLTQLMLSPAPDFTPLRLKDEGMPGGTPNFSRTTEPKATSAAKPRILVVEDDLCLETILKRLLQNLAPQAGIQWMTSADEAWTEVQTKSKGASAPYILFISDIYTPGDRSGIDFWKTCIMRYPDVPFLFTSGMPIEQFIQTMGTGPSCPPFLAKPFAVGQCHQIMKVLLQQSGKRKE